MTLGFDGRPTWTVRLLAFSLALGGLRDASRVWSVGHYADEPLERAAVATLRRFRDKKLSFTDASVIATVKAEGLDGVFGFDEDFRRRGVALYP